MLEDNGTSVAEERPSLPPRRVLPRSLEAVRRGAQPQDPRLLQTSGVASSPRFRARCAGLQQAGGRRGCKKKRAVSASLHDRHRRPRLDARH